MKKSKLYGPLLIAVCLSAGGMGCRPVRPYQRIYLNDRDMQPGSQGARSFETNVFTYREGGSGSESGKSSGGCGCN